jgi:hypothetical protein
MNVMDIFNSARRRKEAIGHRHYTSPIFHDVSLNDLLPFMRKYKRYTNFKIKIGICLKIPAPKFINYFTPSKGKLHQMWGILFWTKDGSHFGNFNMARYCSFESGSENSLERM